MPMRMGNGKISAGVLNNSDSSTNEMSYVDMHDLHPENVQAAVVSGAAAGAFSGATLAAIPGAVALFALQDKVAKEAKGGDFHPTSKGIALAAGIVALGAVIGAGVRAYTAKADADTHNAWSNRLVSHMEQRESAEEANRHTETLTAQREQAAQVTTPQVAG